MEVRDRVAVVTGAGGGIGAALVARLLIEGARKVIATDRRTDRLDALRKTLEMDRNYTNVSSRLQTAALDVANEEATRDLVSVVLSAEGSVDLWFANAGIAGGGGIDATNEVWNQMWQVNTMAHVFAARALLPGWLERREGHLVTTASMAGLLTTLRDGAYAVSKHAAVGFAEWLSVTYGAEGIRVTCVCPGAVDTELLRTRGMRTSGGSGGAAPLSPEVVSARIIDGVKKNTFLLYTHPELQAIVEGKAHDSEAWIARMQAVWANATEGVIRDNA